MVSSLGSALASYEKLILSSSTRVSSIESSLRSLTWFLPGRFQDSELASEALYTLLNILGIYHDSIVLRTVAVLPAPLRPPSSSHARYTRHYTSSSPTYAALARSLTILGYTELLLEMGIKKRLGRDKAEKAVIAIEGLKAVLRLAIMNTTEGRTSVQPPIAEREFDPSVLDLHKPHVVGQPPNAKISFARSGATPRSAADVLLGREGEGDRVAGAAAEELGTEEVQQDYWKGARTGYARPTIASIRGTGEAPLGDPTATMGVTSGKDSVKDFLLTRVLTVEDVKRPQDLVNKAKGLKKLAEVIWILRPLLYVLAMRKWGRRHTLPYLLSLALEYLAFSLRRSSTQRLSLDKASGPMLPNSPSEVEKAETKKRARAFWWYLVRGPVWESWTKPRLEGIAGKFEDKPLIGFVSTLIHDYMPLVDDYYFYTS